MTKKITWKFIIIHNDFKDLLKVNWEIKTFNTYEDAELIWNKAVPKLKGWNISIIL